MAETAPNETLYRHLVRPAHSWRRQLSLKGRNITVGQLIASMRVDAMTPEIAAEQMDLPLEQVEEAIAYYEANKELIDSEFREEKRWLQMKGFARESPPGS